MEITSISSYSSYLEKIKGVAPSSSEDESRELQKNSKEDKRNNTLSEEEKKEVEKLKKTDREVKTHEAAHVAAGGSYVRGGAVFSYETGPDGKRYAVGGEVSIDTSPVPNNPEATIQKMQVVKRAAMAPANPSSQDRAVAASASAVEAQARIEMMKQKREENKEKESKNIKINKNFTYFEKSENRKENTIDLLA